MNIVDRKTLKTSTQGGTDHKRSATDHRYHQGSQEGMAATAKNMPASTLPPPRRKP